MNKLPGRRGLLAAGGALALSSPGIARAQGFPARSLRLVVPFPPGGSTDVVGRIMAAEIQKRLGQPVVVENRPGASGAVGSQAVVRSPADGYTLIFSNVASQSIMPALAPRTTGYDPIRDFTHLGLIGLYWGTLVVHPSFPARDLAGFIAEARRRPGELNYATSGVGSSANLIGELLKSQAGIDVVHVPYVGSGPALAAVAANQVSAMVDSLPSVMPLIRADQLRPLAVSSAERIPALAEVPTFREQGFPDMVIDNWFGISGPAGLPPAVADQIANAMGEALRDPAVIDRLGQMGLSARVLTGQAFAAFIARQAPIWQEAVRVAGVTLD